MLNIDRLDAELIGLLSRDARMGIGELSTALGVARNTVQARLRRLRESGILRGYQPDVDLANVGVAVQAFIALEVEQDKVKAIIRSLAAIPEILEVHITTGREDLLVRVATDTHASLQDLVEAVVGLAGVIHSSTTLALTTPLPYRIRPLLDELTRPAGYGRATPPARGDG